MAVRPSPRAPHSSTCPKLSAALSWSGRPISGLAPASKPLAWASTGSFGRLTVHRTNDRTGSRTAKTGVAGSRRWGKKAERAQARPSAEQHARRQRRRNGRAGAAPVHRPRPHRVTPIGPDAVPVGGACGGESAYPQPASEFLYTWASTEPPAFFPLHCSGLLLRLGSLLSLTDRAEICRRYLHGAALLPFPVTSFRRAHGERPLNFLQRKMNQGKIRIQDAPNSHRSAQNI